MQLVMWSEPGKMSVTSARGPEKGALWHRRRWSFMLYSIWSHGPGPGPSTMACTPLARRLELAELRLVGGVGEPAGAQAVAEREADVVRAHDVADVVEDLVHRVLLVVVEHPFREQAPAAADDADQALAHERQVLAQD